MLWNYLQGPINLTAVKHEVEEVQVVDGGLPGHVVSFPLQVERGSESQLRADDFCSVCLREREEPTQSALSKPDC